MIRRQAIRQTTDSSAISLSGVRSASLTAHRFLSCAASGSSVAPPFLLLYNRRCLKRPTRAGKNSQKVVKLCENSEPAFEQVRRARFVRRRPYETQRVAPNVALLLIRARYYDPLTGEFTSRDPLEYVDGMSLYRGYMGTSGVDPWGLYQEPVVPQDPIAPPLGLVGPVSGPVVVAGTTATAGAACAAAGAATGTPVIVVVGSGAAVGTAGVGVGYCIGRCTTGPVTKWVCDWWVPNKWPPLPRPRPEPRPRPRPEDPQRPPIDDGDDCDRGCLPCNPPVGTVGWTRVDLTGKEHFNKSPPRGYIPTPHIHVSIVNQSPYPGCKCFWNKVGDVVSGQDVTGMPDANQPVTGGGPR